VTAPLALGFVHTAMLGGLALASLPIIIHLLNRRRFRRMDWAAMEFLLKAAVRNRRRVRLENLLLLLLRTLVVLLLVLAVARPFLAREAGWASMLGAEGATERVFLLDNSHSMRAGTGNLSAFRQGQLVIQRVVERLNRERSADRITVVLGSDPRGGDQQLARVPAASAHAARLVERVLALRPGDGSLDLAEAIDYVLENHTESGSRLVLHLISDFRARDWSGPDGELRPDLAEALARFSERGELRLVDVGAPPVPNAGVIGLRPRERAVVAGVPATFIARIRNYGPEPLTDPAVEFRFGDYRDVGQRYEGTTEGPEVVSARLPTDVLPGDDVRRVTVNARRAMRFLLIDGEPDPEPFRGETDFLAAALMPPGDTDSGIRADVVEERSFTGRELELYDAVFLCNVYRIPEDRLARLEEYVRAGGGLVIFLGDQVDPRVYNTTMLASHGEAGGLMPVQLQDIEGGETSWVHLAAPSLDHPVTRFLRGLNEIVFRMVAVEHYIRCTVPSGVDARVVLQWTDDRASPALIDHAFGDGRVLLFTTAADDEWSNFPRSVLYVPLLQEAARYVVRPDPAGLTRVVGEPLTLRFDAQRMQRQATLQLPPELGESAPRLVADPESALFRYDGTSAAGTYTLRLSSPTGEPWQSVFAYNVDPTEGDLRRADPRRLAARLPGATVERVEDDAALETDESDRTEFWRSLIWALVICAGLETILAWRFGHHKSRVAPLEGKQVFVR